MRAAGQRLAAIFDHLSERNSVGLDHAAADLGSGRVNGYCQSTPITAYP